METLLSEIDAFLQANEMTESTFGRLAMNDWKFVRQLRNGRRVWPETAQCVRQFIAGYKPEKQAA
jgi:hypothetical protein